LTDIPEVQAGEAKPEDGAQLIPSLGGGHVARWQRIRAFHVWVSVSRLAVPSGGAETEKPVGPRKRDSETFKYCCQIEEQVRGHRCPEGQVGSRPELSVHSLNGKMKDKSN